MASSPLYDKAFGGYRIFVGGLGNGRTDKHVLHTEFSRFGDLINVWVSRGPRAGFAFVVFMNGEDADVAVKSMDGRLMCGQKLRVEHARLYEGPPPRRKSESLNGGTVRRRSRSRDRRSRSRSPHHRRVHSRSRSRSHSHSRPHKSLSGTPTRSKSPAQSRPRSRSNSSAPNDTSKSRRGSERSAGSHRSAKRDGDDDHGNGHWDISEEAFAVPNVEDLIDWSPSDEQLEERLDEEIEDNPVDS